MLDQDAKIPQPDFAGLIPTMNKMGWMTANLDPISEEFTSYAGKSSEWVLDIGAAYGIATLGALKRGAKVIANDADPRHLELLMAKVPADKKRDLRLMPGFFPQDIQLAPGSVSGILSCRVFHFLTGQQITEALKRCHELLQSHGKLFVIVDTPYLGWLKGLEEEYESRVAQNWPWPGEFQHVHNYSDNAMSRGVPEFIHLFTANSLSQVLTNNDFRVEKWQYIDRKGVYPNFACKDGRESLGMIASKQ